MGVDGPAQFLSGVFSTDGQGGFGDQFRGVGSNRLGAQQPIGRGIGDPLDEAAGMSGSQRFAEVGKGEFADFNRPILFFRLGFGEADTADFGIGEDTGRHEGVESGSAFCEEIFGDDDALASGGVRELWSAIDVADREDGGRPGSPLGIDRNMSGRCGLDADSGEIEFSGHRSPSDGDQHEFGGDGLIAGLAGDSFVAGRDVRQGRAGQDPDLQFLFENLTQFPADILIEDQENIGQHFDEGDLHPESGEQAGEFASDDAAAEDDHRGGQPGEIEEGTAFNHTGMAGQEAWHGGGRSGGDDGMRGFQHSVY